jgi:hypothetical protein
MATAQQDTEAAWELIILFEPMVKRKSTKLFSSEIDEDLKSEMQLVLFRRAMSFKIQEISESDSLETSAVKAGSLTASGNGTWRVMYDRGVPAPAPALQRP